MSPRAASRLETLGFTKVFDYKGGKADWLGSGYPVERGGPAPLAGDATIGDAPTCMLDTPVAELRERMAIGGWSWAAVIDDERVVLGRIRREDVDQAPADARADSVMEEGPSTYRPSVPCAELVDRMKSGGFELAFITDPDGRWLGLVSRQSAERLLEAAVGGCHHGRFTP
jgi:CBS-domain-containing membrane protein